MMSFFATPLLGSIKRAWGPQTRFRILPAKSNWVKYYLDAFREDTSSCAQECCRPRSNEYGPDKFVQVDEYDWSHVLWCSRA